MRRFRDRFRAAPQWRDYFAFLKGTDGLLHICGPARLAEALESLDAILSEIQAFCGKETEIVLFSDHGMNLQENRRVHLKTFLENRGYRWRTRIENGSHKTLVIPAFGLCGYAALYCADEDSIPLVADALAELEGVDFSVYREGQAVAVKGPAGAALLEQSKSNGDVSYRYSKMEGDPLGLSEVCSRLQDKARMNAEGFASEQTWFENTAGHTYPDVLANLYKTVHANRVKHTADVLVSFRDGYYYGWSPFARMVHLAATHGNALGPSSNAFMMSTHRDLPEYIRADDAQALLRG
jgi:hypothetical protein